MTDKNQTQQNLEQVDQQQGDQQQEKYYYPGEEMGSPYGPISFAELEKIEAAKDAAMELDKLNYHLPEMVQRIANRPDFDISDKELALNELMTEYGTLVKEVLQVEIDKAVGLALIDQDPEKAVWSTAFVNRLPDSSFLHILPGGEKDNEGKTTPRTLRMFPVKDASGKVDLPHLRNALARIPQSNRIDEATKSKLTTKAKGMLAKANKDVDQNWFNVLVDKVKTALGQEQSQQSKTQVGPFMIYKGADGAYKWIARYSNNFLDKEQEIISADSHKRFVSLVDSGQASLPELWLWHNKDWKWGSAEWIAYDDTGNNTGFPIAGGTVDKGFEPLAKFLMSLPPESVGVSHGMPVSSIKYDDNDSRVIVEHVTREISPLPATWAANDLTGFLVLSKDTEREEKMIDKKQELQDKWGLPAGILGAVEETNKAQADAAQKEGLDSKSKDDPEQSEAQEQQEQQEQPGAQEQQEQPAEELQPLVEDTGVRREELQDVVSIIGEQIATLSQAVAAIGEQVKALSVDQAQQEAETLTDLYQRAVGHSQARQDKRESLAKDGPRETQPEPDQVIATGQSLVDGIVSSIVTGNWAKDIEKAQKEFLQQ